MEEDVLWEGKASFSLDIHPVFTDDVLKGVKLQLEARLLRWDESLGGVLLGYKDPQRLPTEAPIRPYFVYIKLQVAVDILLFKPRKGAIISGKVTKLGADFIGMTVLSYINAAIGRQNIRADLRFRAQNGAWGSRCDAHHIIEVGEDVIFTVERVQIDRNGVLAVYGSLKEPWTGSAQHTEKCNPAAFGKALKRQSLSLALSENSGDAPGPSGSGQQRGHWSMGSAIPDTVAGLPAVGGSQGEQMPEALAEAKEADAAPRKKRKLKETKKAAEESQKQEFEPASGEGSKKKKQKHKVAAPKATEVAGALKAGQRVEESEKLPNGGIAFYDGTLDPGQLLQPAAPLEQKEKKKKKKKRDSVAPQKQGEKKAKTEKAASDADKAAVQAAKVLPNGPQESVREAQTPAHQSSKKKAERSSVPTFELDSRSASAEDQNRKKQTEPVVSEYLKEKKKSEEKKPSKDKKSKEKKTKDKKKSKDKERSRKEEKSKTKE